MSVNKEDTLRQFCDVTGADEVRSRFFLDSSNWQLEVALSSFYEHGGSADEAPPHSAAQPASLPTLSDSDMDSPTGSPLRTKKEKKNTNTKFATLDSLQQESSSDEEEAVHRRKKELRKYFCDKMACPKNKNNNNSTTKETSEPEVSELDRMKRDIKKLALENSALRKEILRIQNAKTTDQVSIRKGTLERFFHIRRPDKDKKKVTIKEETMKEPAMNETERVKNVLERMKRENERLKDEFSKLSNPVTGQAFYAGGSERSGQQILGPSKGSRKDIVTEMFKSVRERGAVVFEDEPSTASRGRGQVFSGVGYRLGQTSDDHEQVTPPNAQQTQSSTEARSVRLRLYREGFTVDAGPLRHYSDPQNAEFLSCIRRGEIPLELSRSAGGGEVRVSLEDRRHEECPRQGSKTMPFTGKGQMLGSPTPPTVGATAPVAADATDREANQRAAQQAVGLDETQPVTTIQFRLADGSRITGRFNHSHTILDLSQYVSRAEPAYQLQPFTLLTSFPSRELAEPSATIAQANLLNSTLLQRLK